MRRNTKDENDDGIVKDGEKVRVSLTMMDSLQKAIAQSTTPVLNKIGFIRDADQALDSKIARQRAYDLGVLEMESAWKGGLAVGDHVSIFNGQQRMVVGDADASGMHPLKDVHTIDGEAAKHDAYDSYERDLTNAWRSKPTSGDQAGGACVVNGQPGRFCREGGQLVCKPLSSEPSDKEWQLAGPLGDSGQSLRDQAYDAYVDDLTNDWRR